VNFCHIQTRISYREDAKKQEYLEILHSEVACLAIKKTLLLHSGVTLLKYTPFNLIQSKDNNCLLLWKNHKPLDKLKLC
jgi:hypothetical protein